MQTRNDELAKRCKEAGIKNDYDLAHRVGVHVTTIRRLLAHQVEPSARFISGLLKALPGAKFDDLFEH